MAGDKPFQCVQSAYVLADLSMYNYFAIHSFSNYIILTGWVLHPIYRCRMVVSQGTLCYVASFFRLCGDWLRAALGSFELT